MKTAIHVIDLDKTLLQIDSLRWMTFQLIRRYPFGICWLIGKRILHFLSASEFSRQVDMYLTTIPESQLDQWVSLLWHTHQNAPVINLINKFKDADTQIIVCSASPHLYVLKLAKQLGFVGYGSGYHNAGKYTHLFGAAKYNFITEKYPQEQYYYQMAISDSLFDKSLLDAFEHKFLIDPSHGFYIKPL